IADLVRLARGEDHRPVHADGGRAKSIGQEHTYDEDTIDPTRLRRTLLSLSDAVALRLRQNGVRARTVTLKYRTEGFETFTRAETMAHSSDSSDVQFAVVSQLFQGIHRGRKV